MSWPHTLSDLAQLGRELHAYTQSGTWPLLHVMGVMAISAIWKHAWSIPGSVLWVCHIVLRFLPLSYSFRDQNVLAGALFSPAFATILLTTLTTIGSVCASLLSTPLAPFLTYMFPRALDMTRSALNGNADSDIDPSTAKPSTKSSAWVRLSILRLIGVVPWSGINIACGVCGVSLSDCALGTFIGCLPWTAVTCQVSLVPFPLGFPRRSMTFSFQDWRYSPDSGKDSLSIVTNYFVTHCFTRNHRQTRLPLFPLAGTDPGSRLPPGHDRSSSL
jgi:SNARE associated Golgi protein